MGRAKGFKRDEVLAEATKLFWKKGYADTSLTDLEKATGVNKSGLYSEFKHKDDLFQECLKNYSEKNPAFEVFETLPLGWDNVERVMKMNLTCTGSKGCLMALTMRELAIVPAKVRQIIEGNSERMRKAVFENVKAARPKTDPEILTNLILTFVSGLSIRVNSTKPDLLVADVDSFIQLLKKS